MAVPRRLGSTRKETALDTINELLAKPVWSVLVGAAVGAVVTWLAAWWYYRKVGEELRDESKKLRQATDWVIYCLTNKNAQVSAKYDESGHVSGLVVSASGVAHGASQAAANWSSTP